jgi:hypothetical protein
MVFITAFCGRQTSGKSTAAEYLVKKHMYIKLRFSNYLKKMLHDGLGVPVKYIDGDMKNESCDILCGKTARFAMQTLGTEWGRNIIHPDIWAHALRRDIEWYLANGIYRFVIDDLRFISEERYLSTLAKNGINDRRVKLQVIKIERKNVKILDHESENQIEYIDSDWTMQNNLSKEELYKSIDSIFNGGI